MNLYYYPARQRAEIIWAKDRVIAIYTSTAVRFFARIKDKSGENEICVEVGSAQPHDIPLAADVFDRECLLQHAQIAIFALRTECERAVCDVALDEWTVRDFAMAAAMRHEDAQHKVIVDEYGRIKVTSSNGLTAETAKLRALLQDVRLEGMLPLTFTIPPATSSRERLRCAPVLAYIDSLPYPRISGQAGEKRYLLS